MNLISIKNHLDSIDPKKLSMTELKCYVEIVIEIDQYESCKKFTIFR